MSDDLTGRIIVEGVGRAEAVPDIVTVELGARSTAPTAREALARSGERVEGLLALLGAQGVAPRDLRTSGVAIYTDHHPDSGAIRGYTAANTVRATLRDVAGAGQLIDAAAGVVGDDIVLHDVQFSIDDPVPLQAEARRRAVEAARTQAAALAEAAGVRLGGVLGMSETAASGGVMTMARFSGVATAAAAVPLAPGSQQVEVRVTVAFVLL